MQPRHTFPTIIYTFRLNLLLRSTQTLSWRRSAPVYDGAQTRRGCSWLVLAQNYGTILTKYFSVTRCILIRSTSASTGTRYYPGYYHFGIFLFGMTTLGMYSATMGTQPPTPFPTSGHHHITTPHHGRFNERLVHQIYFKIFTYSNNTQELSIMEIPSTGYSRTRDPEHFFFTMTGDWEWSRRAADYWRHFFGVPMRHGGNPFADYYPPDMESAVTQTPQPTIAVLATELQGLLSPTSASGELLEHLTLEQRTTFLSSSQTTPLEDID